ncbi:MAG TPA: sigma-70 family RNA polymerase sigma factor [Pirellulales bacterium]|nr:sigma-70 family RNA polymerase sigma factor [Pirellulales bacterium]
MVRDEAVEVQGTTLPDSLIDDYGSFEVLMNAARAGSREAMDKICRHYIPIIEIVICRHLRERERRFFTMGGSSIIQLTLRELYTDLPAFRGETIEEFNAWVAQLARRNCLDARRQHSAPSLRMRMPLDDCGGEELLKAVTCHETPATYAERFEEQRLVSWAMTRLSPLAQRVLTLRFGDGRSFDEIGRDVGRSAKASQKICERALAKLRKMLNHEQGAVSRCFDNLVRIWSSTH